MTTPTRTYRIETDRLVIRCYEPEDAPSLLESVTASMPHLRPWMAWAHDEEETVEDKLAQILRWRGKFDLGIDSTYAIFDRSETILIGGTGFHSVHQEQARHIGYWIHSDYIRQGYCTEAVSALTRAGFEIEGLQRIDILCALENTASRAIPQRLGYAHEATLRQRIRDGYGKLGDEMVWSMLRAEYESSFLKKFPIRAYDAMSREIIM